jgi:tetratricopeptide (TPR) repeat protein
MLQQGRVDEAIATLQDQIKKSPSDAEAQNLLCRSYFTLANWDRAISACEKATSLQPNNSLYHLWLGRAYGEKADGANFFSAAGLAGKLRTEFETAVRLSPDSVAAHTDLAEFYLEAPGIVGGGRDKAEAQAKLLDKLAPAKAHWVRARIAEKAKDLSTAEKEYRAAIDSSQGGANAWLNIALFYRRARRLDEMENAIKQAASAESGEPVALVDSAETLVRADRNLPEAARLLRRYLASDSKVEEAPAFKVHYLLGTVLEKQGDTQAAANEYSAALALAKGFSRAQDALQRLNR